jgi:hypothetical protein
MILSAIIGFVGGFVPDLLKFFKQREDNKHELAVMNLQIQAQEKAHTQRLEEINAEADIRESEALYKSAEVKLTGVKFIDGLMALYNSSVRPTITYGITVLYAAVKIAQLSQMKVLGQSWDKTVISILWTEFDANILMLTLSYWFGSRQATRVFKLK